LDKVYIDADLNLVGACRVECEKHATDLLTYCRSKSFLKVRFYLRPSSSQVFNGLVCCRFEGGLFGLTNLCKLLLQVIFAGNECGEVLLAKRELHSTDHPRDLIKTFLPLYSCIFGQRQHCSTIRGELGDKHLPRPVGLGIFSLVFDVGDFVRFLWRSLVRVRIGGFV
jgi:hypothetical protein